MFRHYSRVSTCCLCRDGERDLPNGRRVVIPSTGSGGDRYRSSPGITSTRGRRVISSPGSPGSVTFRVRDLPERVRAIRIQFREQGRTFRQVIPKHVLPVRGRDHIVTHHAERELELLVVIKSRLIVKGLVKHRQLGHQGGNPKIPGQ